MTTTHLTLWLDGELLDTRAPGARMPDRGLEDGAGAFESLRSYATPDGPAVFRLQDHMERLQRSLARFGRAADVGEMSSSIPELLRANDLQDASIQPLAWLGGGSRDGGSSALRQAVAALPLPRRAGAEAHAGTRLMSTPYKRTSPDGDPPLKLFGGYGGRLRARQEAIRRGFDDALFLDDRWVCAATTANVFFVRDGQLVAVDHPDAFPGITRDSVIQFGAAICRRATWEELWGADEIFLTGTSAEIAPVTRLDDRHLDIGPVTRALRATYQDIVHGRDLGWRHWLTQAGERRRGAA